MPSRSRREIPECFHGIEQKSDWRDPRTGLILAPGAIQNWPTQSELRWIKQQRFELAEQIRALKATAESVKKN